jgi:hypothetical protein
VRSVSWIPLNSNPYPGGAQILNLTLSVLLLFTVGLATAAFFRSKPPLEPSHQPASNLTSAPEQPTFENGPVRMIRFVLMRDGLYPSQMRVDQGLMNIALEDKTGGSEGLTIESALGDQRTKVSQIRRAEKHWRGRALIKLTPGRYIVSDASQPNHTAELIVSP